MSFFNYVFSVLEIQQTLSRPTLRNCAMLQSHRRTNRVPLAVDRKQISRMHIALDGYSNRCISWVGKP